MVRSRVHRLDQHPEQAEQDRHLDDQGPQASHGVDARLAVEAHGFLGNALPIPAVTVLYLAHLWLQVHHGPHLPQLLDGQRESEKPDNDSENE